MIPTHTANGLYGGFLTGFPVRPQGPHTPPSVTPAAQPFHGLARNPPCNVPQQNHFTSSFPGSASLSQRPGGSGPSGFPAQPSAPGTVSEPPFRYLAPAAVPPAPTSGPPHVPPYWSGSGVSSSTFPGYTSPLGYPLPVYGRRPENHFLVPPATAASRPPFLQPVVPPQSSLRMRSERSPRVFDLPVDPNQAAYSQLRVPGNPTSWLQQPTFSQTPSAPCSAPSASSNLHYGIEPCIPMDRAGVHLAGFLLSLPENHYSASGRKERIQDSVVEAIGHLVDQIFETVIVGSSDNVSSRLSAGAEDTGSSSPSASARPRSQQVQPADIREYLNTHFGPFPCPEGKGSSLALEG